MIDLTRGKASNSFRMRYVRKIACGFLPFLVPCCLAGPSLVEACALSLVLALDVSASVDAREYELQREGLARALTDESVKSAIQAQNGIWLTAFEWSGTRQQYDWLEWQFIDSRQLIDAAANRIRTRERTVAEFPTALGYALTHARLRLQDTPATCVRQVIDIAGDGVNNDGFPPASAYRAMDMTGITVNALVIAGDLPPPVPYYREEVIFGPGAFVEVADGYEDYADAMRRKLLREIGASYVALP
ncbi:DUF1194 domain-containing protein [Amaricoccus macauensis]|uniref:DUF1194 domain-containing protein n=1 Tax=Amaricoccus macauensis TaxID=57001 RepID=UPI003C79AB8E